MPENSAAKRLLKYRKLAQLSEDFLSTAVFFAQLIVSEQVRRLVLKF